MSATTRSNRPERQTKTRGQPLEEESELGIKVISPLGDVVLVVEHSFDNSFRAANLPTTSRCLYRVESALVKAASPYFQRLLDPEKFGEGALVWETTKALRARYNSIDAVPSEELPHVSIKDIGRISSVKSIRSLMADFLSILHVTGELSTPVPPIPNIANLVVVADRFDALPAMQKYFKSRRIMQLLDGKTSDKSNKAMGEERVRQRLLIGVILDNPSWVWQSSQRLIQRGWTGHETAEDVPLWWDLPMGIEEELSARREYVLDTVQSLQSHFLALYTSRDRQCKLGYDSSAECDSYQLGQMIRFFKKAGTISLAGTILPLSENEALEPYSGDVGDLIESLRQCPEYQIDKNHSHCGLRTRLMPLLDLVEYSLTEVGVCMHCWQDCRHEYAWSKVKRPLTWRRDSVGAGMYHQYKARQAQNHLFKHLDTRDLFMAKERLWTVKMESESNRKLGLAFGTTSPLPPGV